jgi:hypothetical protein
LKDVTFGFEATGKMPQAKKCWCPFQAEKSKATDPPRPPEVTKLAVTLLLDQ